MYSIYFLSRGNLNTSISFQSIHKDKLYVKFEILDFYDFYIYFWSRRRKFSQSQSES